MLKPVTQVDVKKEKERLKAMEGVKDLSPTTGTVISEKPAALNGMPSSYSATNNTSNASISSSDDDEDDHEDSHITFVGFLFYSIMQVFKLIHSFP
mgnify:CR=1 FL=1